MRVVCSGIVGKYNYAVLVGSCRFVSLSVYYKANRENFSRNFGINANVFVYYRIRGERNGEGFVGKPTVEYIPCSRNRLVGHLNISVFVCFDACISLSVHDKVNGECFFFIVGRSICAGFTCA